MTTEQTEPSLSETSPSVQAHLGILQSVIQRMGSNSTSCKAWCITVVSAILVIVADKGKPNFAFIALVPTFLFLALDAYYLALEKAVRASYAEFVKKLHSGIAKAEDLYSITPKGNHSQHQIEALKSFSVWGFYATLCSLNWLVRLYSNRGQCRVCSQRSQALLARTADTERRMQKLGVTLMTKLSSAPSCSGCGRTGCTKAR